MEPDRRHRSLSDIYHSPLERSPVVRDAFLTEACAGDDALRPGSRVPARLRVSFVAIPLATFEDILGASVMASLQDAS